ncbi:MAG: glycosyltransferase [Chloroflexi bacterium]|nr:glycosyltransferase [Chloroflexota bacterium]
MTRAFIPDKILSLAHDRAAAREDHNWEEADRLRADIEAAGWKVVDRGTDFALEPAHAPTVAEGEIVRYGSTAAVPSRLDEPPTGIATVVLVATDWPDDVARALAAVRASAPAGTEYVVIADRPSPEQDAVLPVGEDEVEVVRTSERLGTAAAWNIGIRRATGPVVVIVDTSVEPTGDIVSPLAAALQDSTVGVVGGFGIVSEDLRKFDDAPAGDVTAVEGYAIAFRRGDAAERGPLDERFRYYRNLDIWWSLALRDEGQGSPPRRAVAVEIPAIRHEHRGWTSLPEAERDRLSKRNFYRIIDRFGWRRDLASG